jgi:hypothetical protein
MAFGEDGVFKRAGAFETPAIFGDFLGQFPFEYADGG